MDKNFKLNEKEVEIVKDALEMEIKAQENSLEDIYGTENFESELNILQDTKDVLKKFK